MTSAIPELAARAKLKDVVFSSAGFKLMMGRGDLFLLGPANYAGDQITLADVVFGNPWGRLYADTLEQKSTVRVLLFVCTGVNG